MTTNNQGPTDRMTRLRDELVATVNAAPYAKRRFEPRVIVAAIGAFALAGAITGGAISATALSAPPETTLNVDVEAMAHNIVGTHAQLFGTPVVISGSGRSDVDLGERPEGATSIAIALNCVDPGSFTLAVNGTDDSTMSCTADDADSNREHSSGFGSQFPTQGEGRQTITVNSAGSSRYVLWASWSAEAPLPASSALQTAALADGTVSRDEYHAAFDRFAECMSEAGEPVIGGDKSGTLIEYSITNASVDAGIDTQCYEAEFRDVDESWQVANEDTSASAAILRACVVAAGLEPAETLAENHELLRGAGLVESCH